VIFESNPITRVMLEYKRNKLLNTFDVLKHCKHSFFNSLDRYISSIPEKFLLLKAKDDIYKYLNDIKEYNIDILKTVLDNCGKDLSSAYAILTEINAMPIHDDDINFNEFQKLKFLDSSIHHNYLKLIESVFANFIYPIAAYERMKRNKSLDSLDVFNRSEELKKANLSYLSEPYINTIRNAIAHGDIEYKQFYTVYKDKEREENLLFSEMIDLFDQLVDICNGLSCGIRLFYLVNLELLQKNNVMIPRQIMVEEMKAQADSPGWSIINCLETSLPDRKQLVIYAKSTILNTLEIHYNMVRTAILCEKFAAGYDRYFFQLESKFAKYVSWAGFDGKKMQDLRINNCKDINEYLKTIETPIFYVPKIQLPNYFFKFSTFKTLLKTLYPVYFGDYPKDLLQVKVKTRYFDMFSDKIYVKIKASIVIYPINDKTIPDLLKENLYSIIGFAIRDIRRKTKIHNKTKYLPIGYFKLNVFTRDFRVRKIKNSGLINELLCTIEYKRLKEIITIDILGGKPEIIGKYRVVWNSKSKYINE